MNRESVRLVVALVLGIAIGATAAWGLGALRRTQVQIVEGYTTNVDEAGAGIGLGSELDGPGTGYSIAGAWWREEGGPWHTSGPTCLEPLTGGQHVRLGVVRVEPNKQAPGREVVVWLECLD